MDNKSKQVPTCPCPRGHAHGATASRQRHARNSLSSRAQQHVPAGHSPDPRSTSRPSSGAAEQSHMPPRMAAISHRIAGSGPRVAVVAPPRPRGRAAVVAGAAAKGAHRERTLEGASDDLRAAAAQCLDWAPARRRVRAAFAPVLPTLDHCLFKVRCAGRS
jgi:hypothetical protein